MPYFEVDDDTWLFFTDDGARDHGRAAPPVVLIHGWCCDSHDWMFQIPALVGQHRVIAVDLRGHGRSSGTTGLRPRVLASDVAGLLRHLGTGPVVALGHSLGGIVASALAIEHPELVRAVAVVEPGYGQSEKAADRSARSFAALGEPGTVDDLMRFFDVLAGSAPEHLKTWHRRRALGVPVPVARDTFAGMYLADDQVGRREQSTVYLAKRSCPVLAVHSERQAELAAWERTLATGPSDEVHLMPGGHWLHQEHPDAFNELVLAWLSRLS